MNIEKNNIIAEENRVIAEERKELDEVEQFDVEEQCENAIEWIESLAANEFTQRKRSMGIGPTSMCCLGVARYLFSTNGCDSSVPNYQELPTGLLNSAGEPTDVTLEGLYYLNDRVMTHPQIAKHLVTYPEEYFKEEVADAVKRYFWMKEEV